MVYAYIVGPTAQPQTTPEYSGMWWRVECGKSIRIGWLDSQWGEGIEALDICGESLHMQPKCWAMDPAYFGVHAAQELAETYYSINSFYITSAQEMSNLFRADPFKLGMKPYQFIRKFTLLLNFSGTEMQSEDEVATLHKNLQDLQLLPTKRKHEICIRLETAFQIGTIKLGGYRYRHPYDMEDERIMLNILESIRRPVYDLIHRGESVRVFQANLDDWCTPGQKRIEDVGIRYLTSAERVKGQWGPPCRFFSMTEGEWQKVCGLLIITRVSARVGLMSDRRKKRMQMGTLPGITFSVRLMLQATRMSKARTKTARKTRR